MGRKYMSRWQLVIRHFQFVSKERISCGLCGEKFIQTQGEEQEVCLKCIGMALECDYVNTPKKTLPWWVTGKMIGESDYAYLYESRPGE